MLSKDLSLKWCRALVSVGEDPGGEGGMLLCGVGREEGVESQQNLSIVRVATLVSMDVMASIGMCVSLGCVLLIHILIPFCLFLWQGRCISVSPWDWRNWFNTPGDFSGTDYLGSKVQDHTWLWISCCEGVAAGKKCLWTKWQSIPVTVELRNSLRGSKQIGPCCSPA